MTNWLIVPLYNEAARFDSGYWNQLLHDSDFNFLFVNDGSTDQTSRILEMLSGDSHKVLHLPHNVGKAEAIRLGFIEVLQNSQFDCSFLGYIDSDNAFDPVEVVNILGSITNDFDSESTDAIWMSRIKLSGNNIQRTTARHFIGRIIATTLGLGLPDFPYDTQCGFKVFSASQSFRLILEEPFRTRWFVDLELYYRFSVKQNEWMRVQELPLRSWKEVGGSRIGFSSFLTIAKEICRIKYLLNSGKSEVGYGSSRS